VYSSGLSLSAREVRSNVDWSSTSVWFWTREDLARQATSSPQGARVLKSYPLQEIVRQALVFGDLGRLLQTAGRERLGGLRAPDAVLPIATSEDRGELLPAAEAYSQSASYGPSLRQGSLDERTG
jgi:hypothetical protein